MNILHDLLGNVLAAVEPRNERARMWLDRITLRCHEISKANLDPIALRASVQAMRFDFSSFVMIQGHDAKQKELYGQVYHLLEQMTASTELVRH
jgi:hypothetical protein